MTFKEAIKAMEAGQSVYYLDCKCKIIYCAERTDGNYIEIQQESLNDKCNPIRVNAASLEGRLNG